MWKEIFCGVRREPRREFKGTSESGLIASSPSRKKRKKTEAGKTPKNFSIFNSREFSSLLPPISYDWIFRGSSSSSASSGRDTMAPLVRSGVILGAPPHEEVRDKLKCVLVGDGAVGKTSLVVSYTTNGYPTEYIPTAFDNYNVIVNVDNQPLRLQLCDTAGQDDFDSLRPLCYPGCDVFMVCFSVVSPTSFHNVRDKWIPELQKHNPDSPLVLVGTQSDLRTDVKVLIELSQSNERPVSPAAARRLASSCGASGYVESSALTQKNLKEVFDEAILAAMQSQPSCKPTKGQYGPRMSKILTLPPFSLRLGSLRGTNFCGRKSQIPDESEDKKYSQESHFLETSKKKRCGKKWQKLCCFTST